MTPDALRALLGGPALRKLFGAVREALETRGAGVAKTVTLVGLTAEERRAIADLHGWKELPQGERVRVALGRLDSALRESAAGMALEEVVVALTGPLVDRRGARQQALEVRQTMWAEARAHPAVGGRPELLRWLEELRELGLLARAATVAKTSQQALLDGALAAVARLPAPGILLPVLASEVFGDTHALDAGRVQAHLVLRAAAQLAGWPGAPSSASERRRLWSEVGVACDPLSVDVLTLGLRPEGEGLLARHLRELSAEGEPRRVTLRELMRHTLAVRPGMVVFVCENPSVVAAAAERLGARCAALVCTEGVPSTAVLRLLRDLAGSGAVTRFHADFDWAGIRIGNLIAEQVPGARPWRMRAEDFEGAARDGARDGDGREREELEPAEAPVAASWDVALAAAVARKNRAVYEEQVLEVLLEDLGGGFHRFSAR